MKRFFPLLCILCAGVFFFSLPALAQKTAQKISPEKKAAIRELLDLSGSDKIGTLYAQMMSEATRAMLKESNAGISEEALKALEKDIESTVREEMATGSFYEMVYPLYASKFSTREIQIMVKFYKTPLGQKIVKEMPAISEQATLAGQKWGQSIAPKVRKRIEARLKAEGIE